MRVMLWTTVVFALCQYAWIWLKPGNDQLFRAGDDLLPLLGGCIAAAWAFTRPRDPHAPGPRQKRELAPIFIGLGILSYAVGQGIWSYYEIFVGWVNPESSCATTAYLVGYIFLVLGVLLLPHRPLSAAARLRVLLDGMVLLTAIFTAGWYYVLGPSFQEAQGSLLDKLLVSSYLLVDLPLLYCLLVLMLHPAEARVRTPIGLILLGLGIKIIADSAYSYEALHHLYSTGSLLDPLWPVSCLLAGTAIHALRGAAGPSASTQPGEAPRSTGRARDAVQSRPGSLWRILPPYVVALVLGWFVYHVLEIPGGSVLRNGVCWGAGVTFALLLVQQLLTQLENRDLYIQLGDSHRTLERCNAHLEARVRERTAELENSNWELENSNRELEAFAYSISHDLRGPLRGINGYCSVLMEDYGHQLEPEAAECLQRIAAGARHLGEVMDAILGLSSVGRSALQQETVNLSRMAREIAARLQRMEPGRAVEFVIQDRLLATGDSRLLGVVLENLLGNAWKFTRRVSHARITLGAQGQEKVVQGRSYQAYVVSDNGDGFDPEGAHKLFTPFQRLHLSSEFEGHGIGLAAVKRIVERHGGQVWAESHPGRGASFYFTLPTASPPGKTETISDWAGDSDSRVLPAETGGCAAGAVLQALGCG